MKRTKDNKKELNKEIIAMNILEYRKRINLSQERYGEKFGVNGTVIYNIENKKNYPKILLLCKISDYENKEVYKIISNENYVVHPKIEHMEILKGIDENICIRVLLRAICERYKIYSFYNEEKIKGIYNKEYIYDFNSIGYMIRLFRTIKGISLEQLSMDLNYLKETIDNAESGSNALSISAIYRISNYMRIPIDILLVGNLKRKKYIIDYLSFFLFNNISYSDEIYIKKFISAIKERD